VRAREVAHFRERHRFWIGDWERLAGPGAVADQVRFEREWSALHAYAAERGVRVLGDVAIYVAPGSADHRAHPELFLEDLVAGAPPDSFSEVGQLWGNPLYDWPRLRRRRYRWWLERLKRTLDLFDLARIDHFRGFVSYWAVPGDASSAAAGHWRRGPGRALFETMERELGGLPLVAEDLGVITPPVRRLRDDLGLPGMIVIELAFEPRDPGSPHRLENHVENRFIYTGTHDHDTARGWLESIDASRRRALEEALTRAKIVDDDPWWALIRLTFSSPARVAMVQAQDLLGLGSSARMNDPRRSSGNWRWRMRSGALTADLARRLRAATEEAGRLP
jgi:4-alpha-glucanotransferase